MNVLSYYERFNSLSPLSKADFALIGDHLRERSFKKGETIITPGMIQQNCYFMLTGVIMSYYDSDTRIHVQAFAYPPDIAAIPESFIGQKPSPHFLQCMRDSTVLELSHTHLQEALNQSKALERLFRLMTEHLLVGVLTRYTELHALSMEERFRAFTNRSPHLLQLVPHKYIASYLNIDPTNFSKLYNTLKI
ncbi:MAG: Crp/Fnr family transcriptional regulator [Bacteroidetes bacterium]|nr:Crp/Fnr family transcriptional regulator [Bacteroidota bacterium]